MKRFGFITAGEVFQVQGANDGCLWTCVDLQMTALRVIRQPDGSHKQFEPLIRASFCHDNPMVEVVGRMAPEAVAA
jgi:hypothetical protein